VYVRQLADGDIEKLKRLERRFRIALLAAGVIGAIIIVGVGPQVLQFVSARPMPALHGLAPLFGLICLLIALHNSYTAILVYGGATYQYLAAYAAGLLMTLLAGVILIPLFALLGAALSQVAGLVVIVCVSWFFHSRFLRQQIRTQQFLSTGIPTGRARMQPADRAAP
jgi:O-antigen/teichoic acid export membrane protein